MRRNILFILLLFGAVVILNSIQKPIFLMWYAQAAEAAEATELWGVLSHGLSLDMTMAGYICALPILFVLFALLLPHKIWFKLCRAWLYIAAILVAVAFSVNLGLYGYWGFPLDGSVLQYLATPKQAMASVT